MRLIEIVLERPEKSFFLWNPDEKDKKAFQEIRVEEGEY